MLGQHLGLLQILVANLGWQDDQAVTRKEKMACGGNAPFAYRAK